MPIDTSNNSNFAGADDIALRDFARWSHLVFGAYSIKTVLGVCKDEDWQRVRVSMLGETLRFKMDALERWWAGRIENDAEDVERRKIQVTNYVYALKRGGLIK